MIRHAIQRDEPGRGHSLPPGLIDEAKSPNDAILQIQNYLECWKQIAHYIGLARAGRFDAHNESQFLELKAVIAQELEVCLATQHCCSPTREDVHAMINNVPSLRYLGQLSEGSLRNLENQWHMIYIGWQATLGQLKVRHMQMEGRPRRSGVWWKDISSRFNPPKPIA